MPRRPNRFAHERYTGIKLILNAAVVAAFFAGWALFNATNNLGHESSTPAPATPTSAALPPPATPTARVPTVPGGATFTPATPTSEPTRAPTATPTRRSRAS